MYSTELGKNNSVSLLVSVKQGGTAMTYESLKMGAYLSSSAAISTFGSSRGCGAGNGAWNVACEPEEASALPTRASIANGAIWGQWVANGRRVYHAETKDGDAGCYRCWDMDEVNRRSDETVFRRRLPRKASKVSSTVRLPDVCRTGKR